MAIHSGYTSSGVYLTAKRDEKASRGREIAHLPTLGHSALRATRGAQYGSGVLSITLI